MEKYTGISISLGVETSDEEYAAVVEAFKNDIAPVSVQRSIVRASADWQHLPMTIMVGLASGIAPNIAWDLIKLAAKKVLADKRLKKRKTTIVIKRKTNDVIITEGLVAIRNFEENLQFNSIDKLIAYEEQKDDSSRQKDN